MEFITQIYRIEALKLNSSGKNLTRAHSQLVVNFYSWEKVAERN